mgnify:CR=1 FL=1
MKIVYCFATSEKDDVSSLTFLINFALLYKSLLGVSGYKSGEPDEPAVAVMVVQQRNAWGGIPEGGLHMVNLVFTLEGWFVYEPQTGKRILLENYPNAEYVQYILL